MAYSSRSNRARPRGHAPASAGQQLADQAVALAGQGHWAGAADANRELLKRYPKDTSALNRLGKCLTELGRFGEATDSYERALRLDGQNEIARKNLVRLALLVQGEAGPAPDPGIITPQVFIAEPGSSTVTALVDTADPEALAMSTPGAELELLAEGTALVVRDRQGRRLGALEPRLARRLLALMHGGNRYTATLASGAASPAYVILRETYRHPSQAGKTSFPAREDAETVRAYTKNTLLRPPGDGEDDEDAENDAAWEEDDDGETSPEGTEPPDPYAIGLPDTAGRADNEDAG